MNDDDVHDVDGEDDDDNEGDDVHDDDEGDEDVSIICYLVYMLRGIFDCFSLLFNHIFQLSYLQSIKIDFW